MTFFKTKKNNPLDINFDHLYPFINNSLFGQRTTKIFRNPKPNCTLEMFCSDCFHADGTYCSPTQNRLVPYPDESISYKMNNFIYRSDDFNKEDANNNFLFTGCSITFGTGLPYSHTWAHVLNKELGGNKFFNLGVNGASFKVLIFDIYTYIEKFGKPKAIFALMPDLNRFDVWSTKARLDGIEYDEPENPYKSNKTISVDNLRDDFTNQAKHDQVYINVWEFYNNMKNLENFLELLNIDFLWTTWHDDTHKYLNQLGFKNYFNLFDEIREVEHLKCPDEYDKRFWLSARDTHPGFRTHLYYKTRFKNEYKKYMDKKSSIQKSAE
jgi:hypothetical protein